MTYSYILLHKKTNKFTTERLIGDLKRSKDTDELVTLHERQEKRPRTKSKHVKGTSLEVV